jgi:two-component system, OmpR family, sensor kinase
MSRLPIRVRLTIVFALAMAAVLAGLAAFVYLSMRSDLTASVDSGLRSRADDVAALLEHGGGAEPVTSHGTGPAQIVDASGTVVDASSQLGGRRLLSAADLRRAQRGPVVVEHGRQRIRAQPIGAGDDRRVVVVAASLADRDNALERLLTLLLIGGPIALVLASLGGYALAGGALRPVETMRRQADHITDAQPGRRLPIPPARDEIARLGGTLNAMIDRLEAALARERAFVADASHELRTPIAVVEGELELARRPGRSPAERSQALDSAADETDRLARLAEDLLVIARLDRGELPIRSERVDVPEALERAAGRAARRRPSDPRPTTSAEPGLTIPADPLRLDQTLDNLVDNALRHGRPPVELSAERRHGAVELHVRDHGDGFPADFLDTAFERFTRADASRATNGSGLGLAIVQAIAAAHGGEAHATTRPGGGADVWLRLPASSRDPDSNRDTTIFNER